MHNLNHIEDTQPSPDKINNGRTPRKILHNEKSFQIINGLIQTSPLLEMTFSRKIMYQLPTL